jgi:hypothetical protein
MIFESDVKALEFISDWVDKNVPKLSKSEWSNNFKYKY